ncbi:dCTP deaminase/dUTPase family protein [Halalkalicoccus salilacus]|uniref:dCTP deaminase n=1 Tax=Halalkalicoccus salilacus TaxID=3117459 RepID=UPI00300E83D5
MSLTDRVEGIVHEETQSRDRGLDLTLKEVHEIAEPGRVDFGGGELAEAELSAHERTLRNPGDEYGWWYLDAGGYLLEYNETLTEGEPLTLQTREAVRARGAFHPTVTVEDLGPMPLWVGGNGIRLKENARVSTLLASDGR